MILQHVGSMCCSSSIFSQLVMIRLFTPPELMACSYWLKPLAECNPQGPIRAQRCLGSTGLDVLMHFGESAGKLLFLVVVGSVCVCVCVCVCAGVLP